MMNQRRPSFTAPPWKRGVEPNISIQELLKLVIEDKQASWSVRIGESNNELKTTLLSHREILVRFGNEPALEMTPAKLRIVQIAMCDAGLCCSSVNSRIRRVVRSFRWAVARTLLPPEVLQGLMAVEPVRPPQAPLHAPVQCVPVEAVRITIAHMKDKQTGKNVVGDICRLMLLTGMRPGEATAMRGEEIEMCDDGPGKYLPTSHKNAWRSRTRVILLGPQARKVMRPYIRPGLLFTTRSGNKYSSHALAQTVRRACRRAGVEPWSPNQLRHTACTMADERCDLQTASELLGHSDTKQTQRYLGRASKRSSEYVLEYA